MLWVSKEEEPVLDCALWVTRQVNQRFADESPDYGSLGSTRLPSYCSRTALIFPFASLPSASILGPPHVFESVPSVLAHIGVIRIFKDSYVNAVNKHPQLLPNMRLNLLAGLKSALLQRDVQTWLMCLPV